jgi:hypothetical protein
MVYHRVDDKDLKPSGFEAVLNFAIDSCSSEAYLARGLCWLHAAFTSISAAFSFS